MVIAGLAPALVKLLLECCDWEHPADFSFLNVAMSHAYNSRVDIRELGAYVRQLQAKSLASELNPVTQRRKTSYLE